MQNTSEKQCNCHCGDQLVIDRKTISRLTALLFLIIFFTFVTGYFWGKRHAVATFSHKIEQESFADKIYYNTSLLYEHKMPAMSSEARADSSDIANIAKTVEINTVEKAKEQETITQPVKSSAKWYQAQVFGGTHSAAQQCCERLQRKGVPVLMVKRSSKTPKGKTITWYQVVTEPFNDQQELSIVLDAIKLQEKIRDIRIVELADANGHQKKG